MKKGFAIVLTLLFIFTMFVGCGKSNDTKTENTNTQTSESASGTNRKVEPTSVEAKASTLSGDSYAFTAFGKKYTLGKSTLQDFLDDGWTFDSKNTSDPSEPSFEVDAYTYANTPNLIKNESIIYYPRFVNFSKNNSCPLSQCKLLYYTVNFSGKNVYSSNEPVTPSGENNFELPLGINGTFCMADLMDKVESVGLGHYEQDYDTYYTFYATHNYDDADESYSITAAFSKDTQIIQSVTVEISTFTNGEFDEA